MKPLARLIRMLSGGQEAVSLVPVTYDAALGEIYRSARETIDKWVKHKERITYAQWVELSAEYVSALGWEEHPHNGSSYGDWRASFDLAAHPGLEQALVGALRRVLVYQEQEKIRAERNRLLEELAEKRVNALLEKDE